MQEAAVFPVIPAYASRQGVVGKPTDYGAGNYVTLVENTTKDEYDAYLARLKEAGFARYADNGDGLGGAVFSTTLLKGNAVLTVTHVLKRKRTYVSLCMDLPLSEHLFYRPEYVLDNKSGAKTTLHMLELWHFGNSFVIQLKNGHFIVSDGGSGEEIRYLLDYLESLTPAGEKPVVEGWFISHGHGDHHGALGAICWERGKELGKQVLVDGIYFNEPPAKVYDRDPWCWLSVVDIRGAARYLRGSTGRHPAVYRPQTGQRYYFNDITIDIIHAQEQLPSVDYMNEDYPGDFNDSSTWCMATIDGQKVLLTGDGDVGAMDVLMETYDRDYFHLDVMTLMHHGFNTYDRFTDYIQVDTVLVTARDRLPVCRKRQNAAFRERVKEWFFWGEGTRVLTFPYRVGESRLLPHFAWKYHEGRERPRQGNMDVEV